MGKKQKPEDVDTLTAEIIEDLLQIAAELDGFRGRVLEHWGRLQPYEKTFPRAAFEDRVPMTLPHRTFGELRDVASALEETAGYVRSTAERTPLEIQKEWEAHQVQEAEAEAYATIKTIEAILNEPGSDAATALRSGAERLTDLADRIVPVGQSGRPYVAPGWLGYHRSIRTWLAQACRTQTALAEQLGVAPAKLSYTIRGLGSRADRGAILAEVARVTGISPPADAGGAPREKEGREDSTK